MIIELLLEQVKAKRQVEVKFLLAETAIMVVLIVALSWAGYLIQ